MKQYYIVLILQKNRRWNRQNSFYYKNYTYKCMNCTFHHSSYPYSCGAGHWNSTLSHGHNSYFSVWCHSVFFRSKVWTDIIFHLLLLMKNKNLDCIEADDVLTVKNSPQSSFWTSHFARKISFAKAAVFRVHTYQHLWSLQMKMCLLGWCDLQSHAATSCCCFLLLVCQLTCGV